VPTARGRATRMVIGKENARGRRHGTIDYSDVIYAWLGESDGAATWAREAMHSSAQRKNGGQGRCRVACYMPDYHNDEMVS
jgi:hypothetical protein